MKNKRKAQKNSGITLVALVVTIVVLLILAGVSINLVVGQNGIITRAGDAKKETKRAEIEDKISLALGSAQIEGLGKVDMDELNSELSKIGYTGSPLTSLPATIEIDGDYYTINGEGTVTNTKWHYDENGKITDGTITFEIGEYVNYSQFVDESKSHDSLATENGWASQVYTANKATTWRVMGLNESNELLLISGAPIQKRMSSEETAEDWQKDPYLYMKGAYSYVNCKSMLNNICDIYDTSVGNARSMTIEDINTALGVVKEGNTVYVKTDAEKTNIDVGGFLGNSYTYKVGDYTPEGYLADQPITQADVNAGKKENFTSYGYLWAGISSNDTLNSMLFAGTTDSDNYAKSYWLASPGSCADSSGAVFGPGVVGGGDAFCGNDYLFYSYGNWNCNGFAVRPVVALNSDISSDNIAKLKQNPTTTETVSWDGFSSGNTAGSGDASTGKAGTQTGSN